MVCPNCKNDSAHRSHRAGLTEHMVSVVGYHPYRCPQCKVRFLKFRYSLPEAAPSAPRGVEREIAATQGALRRQRKRRELLLYVLALLVFGVVLYLLTRTPSMGD
jgi:hypothetical protein